MEPMPVVFVEQHRLHLQGRVAGTVAQRQAAAQPHFVAVPQQGHRVAGPWPLGLREPPAVGGLLEGEVAIGHRETPGDHPVARQTLHEVQLKVDVGRLAGRRAHMRREEAQVQALPPAFNAPHGNPARRQELVDGALQAGQLPAQDAPAHLQHGEAHGDDRDQNGGGGREPLHGASPTGRRKADGSAQPVAPRRFADARARHVSMPN